MSPGSYMSSESAVESAGSSNSIDDTEIGYGTLSYIYPERFISDRDKS